MTKMTWLGAFKRLLIIIFVGPDARGAYRCEKHYMRGPGPKYKERNAPIARRQ